MPLRRPTDVRLTLRFYAQLNDFLAPNVRRRRFDHTLTASTSVKDTIEALGVPHPEVGLILVNGVGQSFTYLLKDGDDVAVYPEFRQLAIKDTALLRPPRNGGDGNNRNPMRAFVLDIHLGKLAAFLRLGGLDAVLHGDDADIATIAATEGRIVLTRDIALLKRSAVTYGYWVRETNPERQFAEVIDRFDLEDLLEPFTRCMRCNAVLAPVDREAVADRLPPRVRATFHDFRLCTGCQRVYWAGSHHRRLAELVERARSGLTRT